jgi:hypothetical protein
LRALQTRLLGQCSILLLLLLLLLCCCCILPIAPARGAEAARGLLSALHQVSNKLEPLILFLQVLWNALVLELLVK